MVLVIVELNGVENSWVEWSWEVYFVIIVIVIAHYKAKSSTYQLSIWETQGASGLDRQEQPGAGLLVQKQGVPGVQLQEHRHEEWGQGPGHALRHHLSVLGHQGAGRDRDWFIVK